MNETQSTITRCKDNGVVLVLVQLPHDLFIKIIKEWIKQPLFVTFVVLDFSAQNHKSLKDNLLSHFKFLEVHFTIDFSYDAKRGYYCDGKLTHVEQYCTHLSSDILFDIFELDEYGNKGFKMINCCRNLQVLRWNDYGNCLCKIVPSVFSSLTSLHLSQGHNVEYDMKIIKNNCFKLRELSLFSVTDTPAMNKLVVEFVQANPQLTLINTMGRLQLLDVIYHSCAHIVSITLRTLDTNLSSLMQVGRFFERSSSFKCCKIIRFDYDHNMRNYNVIDIVKPEAIVIPYLQKFTEADVSHLLSLMTGIKKWSFDDVVNDVILNQIVEADAGTMKELECPYGELLTLSSVMNMFQQCCQLEVCTLQQLSLSCSDVLKLFQSASVSLKRITLEAPALTMSGVITILQTCQHFEYCQFYDVIDDALDDSSIVVLFKKTLIAYPLRQIDCFVTLEPWDALNINNIDSVRYRNSCFCSCGVPHYELLT